MGLILTGKSIYACLSDRPAPRLISSIRSCTRTGQSQLHVHSQRNYFSNEWQKRWIQFEVCASEIDTGESPKRVLNHLKHSGRFSYRQVQLEKNNCTFCPYILFASFVWISE